MSLAIERHTEGALLALRLSGVIDESWNGKKAAAGVRAETLVIDLAGVSRISSFGIREWVDFVDAVCASCDAVLLVECSTKIVHQLNMVANFAGAATLVSFYAPYRCDYCDSESEALVRLDRDAELIASGGLPDRPCGECGEAEYFDEDPATYLSFAAAAPAPELEPEVAAFLASRLRYEAAPSARRLRADKQVEGRATYLRLTGDLDGSFPAETLADGLEGRVFLELSGLGQIDPAGAAAWRRFVDGFADVAEAVLIAGAPPLFVEKLTGDLGGAAVISMGLPYRCERCNTSSVREVDVAEHRDVLTFATPPELMCPDCASPLVCVAGEELLARLPKVPAAPQSRDDSRQLERFRSGLARARRPSVSTSSAGARRGPSWIAAGAALIAVLFVIAAALFVYIGSRRGERPPGDRATRITEADPPAWADGLAPLAGRCDEGDIRVCAASSTLAMSEQQAIEQAQLVAVDEMTWAFGWGDDDAASRRARLLGRLADAGDWTSPAHRQLAAERVAASRAVAESLVRAGGGTLDPELVVETWEVDGQRRWRAFARLAIDGERAAALTRTVGAVATSDLGVSAVNFPPPLVWRHRSIRAGALLRSIDEGPLVDLGLRKGYVVTSIQGQTVDGAKSFVELLEAEVSRLGASGGQLRMVVHTGSGEPMTFVREWKPPANERPATKSGDNRSPPERPTFNTWREAGGDRDPKDAPEDDPDR